MLTFLVYALKQVLGRAAIRDDIMKKILSSEDFYIIKLANTSLALINSGNVLNSCEEVEIIGTWMNLTFQLRSCQNYQISRL